MDWGSGCRSRNTMQHHRPPHLTGFSSHAFAMLRWACRGPNSASRWPPMPARQDKTCVRLPAKQAGLLKAETPDYSVRGLDRFLATRERNRQGSDCEQIRWLMSYSHYAPQTHQWRGSHLSAPWRMRRIAKQTSDGVQQLQEERSRCPIVLTSLEHCGGSCSSVSSMCLCLCSVYPYILIIHPEGQ